MRRLINALALTSFFALGIAGCADTIMAPDLEIPEDELEMRITDWRVIGEITDEQVHALIGVNASKREDFQSLYSGRSFAGRMQKGDALYIARYLFDSRPHGSDMKYWMNVSFAQDSVLAIRDALVFGATVSQKLGEVGKDGVQSVTEVSLELNRELAYEEGSKISFTHTFGGDAGWSEIYADFAVGLICLQEGKTKVIFAYSWGPAFEATMECRPWLP